MGGVDLADQLKPSYAVDIECQLVIFPGIRVANQVPGINPDICFIHFVPASGLTPINHSR